MPRLILAILITPVLLIVGCDTAEEVEQGQGEGPQWTEQEQVYSAPPTTTVDPTQADPQARAEQFFQALRGDQVEQAVALIAERPLDVGEADLVESVRQWADEAGAAQSEFLVLDSRQAGDFALVTVQFTSPERPEGLPVVRPVVMFREEGQWKLVWELLGMLPDRVADVNPGMAQRLRPLYDWYEQQQLRAQTEGAAGQPMTPRVPAEALEQGQGGAGQPQG